MDSRQKSLFDGFHEIDLPDHVGRGTLNMRVDLLRDLNEAVKKARIEKGYSRARIAAEMTDLIFREGEGGDISKTAFDSWTAESKKLNRFPAEYLPAFIQVTGSYFILERMAQMLGCVVLRKDEAIIADFGAAALEERRASDRRKALEEQIDPQKRDLALNSISERYS